MKHEKYVIKMINEINKMPDNKDNHYYYKHLGDSYLLLREEEKALSAYFEAEKRINRLPDEFDKDFRLNLYRRMLRALLAGDKENSYLIESAGINY